MSLAGKNKKISVALLREFPPDGLSKLILEGECTIQESLHSKGIIEGSLPNKLVASPTLLDRLNTRESSQSYPDKGCNTCLITQTPSNPIKGRYITRGGSSRGPHEHRCWPCLQAEIASKSSQDLIELCCDQCGVASEKNA